MKLRTDIDHARFLQAVQTCRGEVWFLTAEGDRLNLKSALSQMIFAVAAVGIPGSGEVICEQSTDLVLLQDYLTA